MRALLGLLNVVSLFASIWALVDMARIPERHWEHSGRTKPHWLGLVVLTLCLGVGVVGVGIYVLTARPDLKRRQRAQEASHAAALDQIARERRSAGASEPDLAEVTRRLRRGRLGDD